MKLKEVKGIKGGGYLPQNNFIFQDLNQASQIEVLEKNPCFEFDIIDIGERPFSESKMKENGNIFCGLIALNKRWDNLGWMIERNLNGSAFNHAFQLRFRNITILLLTVLTKKVVSVNCSAKVDGYPVQVCQKFFYHPMVQVIGESLLVPESTWDKVVDHDELKRLMSQKTRFFRNTPLSLIFEKFGFCHGLVEVINDQLNLNLKFLPDGIELLSFSSVKSFARRTGIDPLIRKSNGISTLPDHYCSDLFHLGWLTFRKRKCPFKPLYIHIQEGAVMYLFSSLNLNGSITPKKLLQELIYLFGPPDIFQSPRLLVA